MKVKHFYGWALLLLAFTNLSSCSEDEMPGIDEPVSTTEAEAEEEESKEPNKFPFPKLNTNFEIRTLLYSHQQPTASELNSCFDELTELSASALNSSSMTEAKNSLRDRMEGKETIYHWCFFHLIHQVDQKLDATEPELVEKSNYFLENFKKAWILGVALDLNFEKSNYFDFVRRRYIKVNRQYFGRNLESSTPPFSDSLSLPSLKEEDAPAVPPQNNTNGEASQGEDVQNAVDSQ